MFRLPAASRQDIPAEQREAFDEVVRALDGVPPYGPGTVMIHVPKAHMAVNALNRYLRDESSLPKKILELAMLVTARELDCRIIWNAHAADARKAGLDSGIVEALRERRQLPSLSSDEAVVIDFGREWFRTHRVAPATFQSALALFSTRGVVELALLFGNYSLFAILLNGFDADLPATGEEPVLPVD